MAKRRTGTARRTSKPKASAKKIRAVPAGYHTITPALICRGAAKAIEFYKKALGAKERARMQAPDGSAYAMSSGNFGWFNVAMANIDGVISGRRAREESTDGTAGSLFIYIDNVDKAYAKAIAAGAKSEMAPTDMFWGDRYGKFIDPFGHRWAIATHIEDMTPKEMERRGAEWMKKNPMPQKNQG